MSLERALETLNQYWPLLLMAVIGVDWHFWRASRRIIESQHLMITRALERECAWLMDIERARARELAALQSLQACQAVLTRHGISPDELIAEASMQNVRRIKEVLS